MRRRRRPPDLGVAPLERRLHEIYRCIAANAEAGRSGLRAEEWLIDNRHVVQDALAQVGTQLPPGFLRQLPLIVGEGERPVIRIQDLAAGLVRLAPRPLDIDWLERAVEAFQDQPQAQTPHLVQSALSIGELWALPSFVRLAILQDLAQTACRCLGIRTEDRNLEGEAQPEDVAGAIIGLRHLDAHDWRRSFERLSRAERVLRRDPAGAYARMDFGSRNRYRGAVEELARGSARSEIRVAEAALARCEAHDPGDPRTRHVGHYLVGAGRPALEADLRCRQRLAQRLRRGLLRRPGLVYFGPLAALSLPPLFGLWTWLAAHGAGTGVVLGFGLLSAIPILGLAVTFLNALITWRLPPRVLPRMDYEKGIPAEYRTVVVMPVLLPSREDVAQVLERIEINYLNNDDRNLAYAILSDWTDAAEPGAPGDAELLEQAMQGIRALNRRYATKPELGPFLLLHRERRWNAAENRWMGWERKRGKLVEFHRLLAGDTQTSYRTCVGNLEALRGVHFVITLDADTQMPPGAARRLVGTLAHPLNRAVLDPARRTLRAGYAILQPRLEIDPDSADATGFAAIYAGDTRVDLYTHAASDVYHDLFGEGIYAGKGIYDWRAFEHALKARIPENTLLSHDLLEGVHGRVGLVSDTILFEQFPPNAAVFMRRLHRWVRGDWQLLPWLRPWVPTVDGRRVRNRLSAIHQWKILDNLRRSLQAPAVLALLALAWSGLLPGAIWAWTLLVIGVQAAPLLGEVLGIAGRGLADPGSLPRRLRLAPAALRRPLQHWLLALALLPYESLVVLDAIGRTGSRLLLTRRRLLEWITAADVHRQLGQGLTAARLWREMWVAPLLALLGTGGLAWADPAVLAVAAPLLLAWLASPWIASRTARPARRPQAALGAAERRGLRVIARRTWLFFEQFVGPDDHWLAPDNFQEEPVVALARRTSPTNIGMSLATTLAAHDLGYIDLATLASRLRNTFETLARLERYRGHWLNWYETRDLRPLLPRYVSTVDSGNLAASLVVLARGLESLRTAPVTWRPLAKGLVDTLYALEETLRQALAGGGERAATPLLAALRRLRKGLTGAETEPDGWQWLERLREREGATLAELLLGPIEAGTLVPSEDDLGRLRAWLDELQRQANAGRRQIDGLQPWLRAFAEPPRAYREASADTRLATLYRALRQTLAGEPPLCELAQRCRAAGRLLGEIEADLDAAGIAPDLASPARNWNDRLRVQLDRAAASAERLADELRELAAQADRWVEELDFAFLYNRNRHLFRIGYNVTTGHRDPNYYDLLASEARLAAFIAIAKGEVPVKHWLHLGRPFRRDRRGAVLMSWSATLFEYLMPSLFMAAPEDSLLGRACRNAIAVHREFAERLHLPWGISESGYYHLDDRSHYQYRAFGVPGLGFRSDLGDRVVVAPYACAMALPFDAAGVVENFERLRQLHAVGHFGLYEAIDFGRTEKAAPRRARIVRSYMSHHQGMLMLAIDNALNGDPMPRRFHADPRMAGIAMLLHERPPPAALAPKAWARPPQLRAFRPQAGPQTWAAPVRAHAPHYALLSNGHYCLLLDTDGGGASTWDGVALTRWQPDRTTNEWGYWCYVKDRDAGATFSLGVAPSGGDAERCAVQFGPHLAEFQRREHDLFCHLGVALSSQHDVEARKLVIRNESMRPRRLLVAGFAELAMAPAQEFLRHPAFARLFVESECLEEESILLFRRRPRGAVEKPLYLAHSVLATPDVAYRFGWDTERGGFLGRCGHPARPRALRGGLEGFAGRAGTVLDPAIATGIEFTLAPHARIEVGLLTAVGRSRREVLATLRSYRSLPRVNWIFEEARMQTGQELHNLEIDPATVHEMQDLLSAVLAPRRELRGPGENLARSRAIQPLLWSRGISGDWPILLVRIRDSQDLGMIEPLLKAHTFWCGRQARIDLVLIDEEVTGYAQPARDRLQQMIAAVRARTQRKLAGTAVVVAGAELRPEERAGIYAAARVVLDTEHGPFAAQLAQGLRPEPELPPLAPVRSAQWAPLPTPPLARPAGLPFANGYGGFSTDGREYVLHLASGAPEALPPAPWSNVIANPDFGCLLTESGSSCTWAGNSSEQRLTPWPNDPVRDRGGEVLYLRDEETGEVWTPTPQPIPADGAYQVRHGAGYSEFAHHSHGLIQGYRVHVDPELPVKLCRLTLTNTRPWTRRLTATYYAEWVLGTLRPDSAPFIVGDYDPETCALLARNIFSRLAGETVAFLTASRPPHGLSADRLEFLGRGGDLGAPAALRRIGLSGHLRPGDDPCAVYQVHLDIAPGATQTLHFVLGQGADRAQAIALARRFRDAAEVEASWARNDRRWEAFFGALQVDTPEPAMDLLLNRWLPYQVLACRLLGRSGYYQSSGAYGFRDQLQDAMALTWAEPESIRAHLLRAAGRQFADGDVLHWWHEAPLRGVRTRCSDDLLWLPFVTAHYLACTGDWTILNEIVPYLSGTALQRDESEHYAEFSPGDERGSLYEHCCRAIDHASTVGAHGLPTIGSGDWNDGLNRVSTNGRGESVWLAWFLARVCEDFAPCCERLGDPALAVHYRALAEEMRRRAEAAGWDGQWYRRAYYDDGSPLGSAANEECRIDLIAQTWAVLAMDRPSPHARQALASALEHLVREKERLILLLAPPFDRTAGDPGYIKGYPPGIRENGGQYTHAATWAVWACAKLGDGERAMALFRLLNPILRARTPEQVQRYRVEPYVLAGDVYGVAPHAGRGGWTWYSGAAGWLYRAGVEALLGLHRRGQALEISPCLPADWPGYRARLRHGRSDYWIEVENPDRIGHGEVALALDGQPLDGRRLPFVDDGRTHRVQVRIVAAQAVPAATGGPLR